MWHLLEKAEDSVPFSARDRTFLSPFILLNYLFLLYICEKGKAQEGMVTGRGAGYGDKKL